MVRWAARRAPRAGAALATAVVVLVAGAWVASLASPAVRTFAAVGEPG